MKIRKCKNGEKIDKEVEEAWKYYNADKWNQKWLRNRTEVLAENMGTDDFSKVIEERNRQIENIKTLKELHTNPYNMWDIPSEVRDFDTFRASILPEPIGLSGRYIPKWHTAVYYDSTPETLIHERSHASDPKPQLNKIESYKSNYLLEGVEPNDYLDNSNEILSRLMELRYKYNLDPKHSYSREELEELNRLEEKSNHRSNLFNRYTIDYIYNLINNVAQHPLKQIDQTLIARFGGKLIIK